MKVVFDKELPSKEKTKLEKLAEITSNPASPLNLNIETHDVSTLTEAQQWSLRGLDKVESLPSFIVEAPKAMRQQNPLFIKPLSDENLASLSTSPVREQIVKHILSGESAVWVLLLSGDQEKDQKTREALQEGIALAEQNLKISEGVIDPDKIEEAEAKGEIDYEDVLRSKIPLKISFTIVELSQDDQAETEFIKMITSGMPKEAYAGQNVVAPIFGRGRCLGPMRGSSLTPQAVLESCEKMCGECECSVKSENPGYDIILSAEWDKHVDVAPIVSDKVIPDLTGAGDFIDAPSEASNPDKSTTSNESKKSSENDTDSTSNDSTLETYTIPGGSLTIAVVGLLAIVGVGSFFVMRRSD